MTTSGTTPRATSSGRTSAALPTSAMDLGCSPFSLRVFRPRHRLFEVVGDDIHVTQVRQTPFGAPAIDFDEHADAFVHGDLPAAARRPSRPGPR